MTQRDEDVLERSQNPPPEGTRDGSLAMEEWNAVAHLHRSLMTTADLLTRAQVLLGRPRKVGR